MMPVLATFFLSAILFGIGGYYLGNIGSRPIDNIFPADTENTDSIAVTPSSSPAPITDQNPESNWNVFQNTKHNYSFKYPSSWQLRTYGGDSVSTEESDSFVIEGPYDDVITLKGAPKFAIRVDASTNEFPNEANPAKYISVMNGSNLFIKFELSSSEIPPQSLDPLVLDQILSTFKFTY